MENDKTAISFSDLILTPDWARQPPSLQKKIQPIQRTEESSKEGKRKDKKAVSSPVLKENGKGKAKKEEKNQEEVKKAYYDANVLRKYNIHKLPIGISFIPERHGLKTLVTRLSKSLIAYPLLEIASMFLTKPEYYDVKYEVDNTLKAKDVLSNNEIVSLFQCKQCEHLFLEKTKAEDHILSKHFHDFFDVEEKQIDPPKGNFLCVAKCSLSGDVLCPPNYHEFNDKLLELHRSKFAYMSQEEFRKTIVNDSDPKLLEQWKKEASVQKIYKLKAENKSQQKEFYKKSDADLFILTNYMLSLIKEGKRFVIPGTISVLLEDQTLSHLTRIAFEKEKKSPVKIAAAIYPAFKNLGMKIFKWHGKITYVAGVAPTSHPLEPEQTTGTIRQILEWMNSNRGKTRLDMLNALVPGASPESSAYAEVVSQLRWLIERGFILEFSDGKLDLVIKKHQNKPKEMPNNNSPQTVNTANTEITTQ